MGRLLGQASYDPNPINRIVQWQEWWGCIQHPPLSPPIDCWIHLPRTVYLQLNHLSPSNSLKASYSNIPRAQAGFLNEDWHHRKPDVVAKGHRTSQHKARGGLALRLLPRHHTQESQLLNRCCSGSSHIQSRSGVTGVSRQLCSPLKLVRLVKLRIQTPSLVGIIKPRPILSKHTSSPPEKHTTSHFHPGWLVNILPCTSLFSLVLKFFSSEWTSKDDSPQGSKTKPTCRAGRKAICIWHWWMHWTLATEGWCVCTCCVLCAVCKACICRSFKVAEPKMELLNPRQFFSTLLQREQHFFRLSTKTG